MNKSANVCVLTVLFINGICSFANSFLNDVNKSTILHLHNRLRRNFANGAQGVIVANMNKLLWSYELERRAARAIRCGRPIPNVQGYYGLNMNVKSNSNGNFSVDILSWYNELDQYYFSPEDESCWPSYRRCLSAYTLLNAKHRSVGCAFRQNCPGSENALLCLYDGSTRDNCAGRNPKVATEKNNIELNAQDKPQLKMSLIGVIAGVILFWITTWQFYSTLTFLLAFCCYCLHQDLVASYFYVFPFAVCSGVPFYKPGPVCTKCEGDSSFCENGLCVTCNTEFEDCDCRKSCNVPRVGLGVLNNTSCTCQCQYGMGPNCDEPCENPEQFEDYDICSEISPEMCDDQDYVDMFAEFCPTLCSCKKFPN